MGAWQRQLVTYHPVIGWWGIPNLRAMIAHEGGPYLLTTNSVGMRSNCEYPKTKPRGRRRLVLLGDSYTAGTGVTNSDRFSDQLERLYPSLDVMNFGLAGSGTDQQLLIYELIAKSFEADAYLFAPCTSNILRNQLDVFPMREYRTGDVWYRPKPYFTINGGGLTLCNQPVPNELVSEKEAAQHLSAKPDVELGPSWKYGTPPSRLRENSTINRIYVRLAQTYDGYESTQNAAWLLMRAILERFLDEVRGKPVLIAPIPTYQHFMTTLSPTYMTRFSELNNPQSSRIIVDVLPYFKRLSVEDRRNCYFGEDQHYTARGHQVVSECISDALGRYCPEILS